MEQGQAEKIALMAATIAGLAALVRGRLPRWLRITVVVSVAMLACTGGLLGYRYATHPATLTVATGSIDGDATRLMTAIATRMAAINAPVRLKVSDKGTALDAGNTFAAGNTDLAIVRADAGDLSSARTVVVMTYGVLLIAVPSGSAIDSMDALKGKTVGVIAATANQNLVAEIVKAYDLDRARVSFKDVSPSDALQALQSKQIQALLAVLPVSDKYLSMLRDIFPRGAKKLGLVPLELAGAIAGTARAYESYDLPKGTVRGSPAIPDEDMATLRVPFYLVANKKLPDSVVAALTKTLIEVRRDLVGEYPLVAQVSAPSVDKDAYIPIHPGAAAYLNGEQQSFVDRFADKLFYLAMLLGFFASVLAATWKFMTKDTDLTEAPLTRLNRLMDQIKIAGSEADLSAGERGIDELLEAELEKYSRGESDGTDCAVLGLAIQRLNRLAAERRATFGSRPRAVV